MGKKKEAWICSKNKRSKDSAFLIEKDFSQKVENENYTEAQHDLGNADGIEINAPGNEIDRTQKDRIQRWPNGSGLANYPRKFMMLQDVFGDHLVMSLINNSEWLVPEKNEKAYTQNQAHNQYE